MSGEQWMQAGITVLIGAVVYVFGEIIKRAFLDPINEQRQVITEIAASLVMFANRFAHTGFFLPEDRQSLDEARLTLRRHAAEFDARTRMIPWYGLWSLLHLVPPWENALEAIRGLIGISNHTPPRNPDEVDLNDKQRAIILKSLGLSSQK